MNSLQSLRARLGFACEIIVVDGGSDDQTRSLAAPFADLVLNSAPGRAAQMNHGATAANADLLLFLHADTRLSVPALRALLQSYHDTSHPSTFWGRFDVSLDAPHWPYRVIESLINLRSRVSGIATGDQGIFVCKALFESVCGFPQIALMEDIAMSRNLKRKARPMCIRAPVQTSARRWQTNGILETILLMWRLRLLFALGVDPARLVKVYYGQ